jgi:hypothetical protein
VVGQSGPEQGATPTGFEPQIRIATRRTITAVSRDHAWLSGLKIPVGPCPSWPFLAVWATGGPQVLGFSCQWAIVDLGHGGLEAQRSGNVS